MLDACRRRLRGASCDHRCCDRKDMELQNVIPRMHACKLVNDSTLLATDERLCLPISISPGRHKQRRGDVQCAHAVCRYGGRGTQTPCSKRHSPCAAGGQRGPDNQNDEKVRLSPVLVCQTLVWIVFQIPFESQLTSASMRLQSLQL